MRVMSHNPKVAGSNPGPRYRTEARLSSGFLSSGNTRSEGGRFPVLVKGFGPSTVGRGGVAEKGVGSTRFTVSS